MNEWVSLKDKYPQHPPRTDIVLLATKKMCIPMIGYLNHHNMWSAQMLNYWVLLEFNEVTHWMKLPELPKKYKKKKK